MTSKPNIILDASDPITALKTARWDDLDKIVPDLPDSRYLRYLYLKDLYEAGALSSEVQAIFDEVITDSSTGQETARQFSVISESLSSYLREEVDHKAAEQSFETMLSERWDEFGFDELSSDQVEVGQRPQLVVEGPQRSSRRRRVSAFIVTAAAAILFAYGPSLIERDIDQPDFPVSVTSVSSSIELPADAVDVVRKPLADRQGTQLSQQFKLESIEQVSSAHHWSFNVSDRQGTLLTVELQTRKLSSLQSETLTKRLGEVKDRRSLGSAQKVDVAFERSGQLTVAKYIHDQELYQWTSSAPQAIQLTETLIKSLMTQMTDAH